MLTRRRTRAIQHDHLDAERKAVGSEIQDLEPPKVKSFSKKILKSKF